MCYVLKNHLLTLNENSKLLQGNIIVVNNGDPREELIAYIKRKNIPFVYYKTDTSCYSWSAPTIGYYDTEGKLVHSSTGGSKIQANIIAAYILKKDKLLAMMKWKDF